MNFNSVSNTPYNSFYNDNPYRQYGYAQMPEIAYQPVYNQPYQYMQEPPSQENPAKTLGLALFLQGISSGLKEFPIGLQQSFLLQKNLHLMQMLKKLQIQWSRKTNST